MKFEFVEIGTSYFNTLAQERSSCNGLSIEPISEYLDMLPSWEGLIKVNAAIMPSDGVGKVFYVDFKDISNYNLPDWVAGCNSIFRPHPTVYSLLSRMSLLHLIKTRDVELISPSTLFKRYDIEHVDYLKIDIEGSDGIVLNAWIDACLECNMELPNKIEIENNGLDTSDATTKVIERMRMMNFLVEHRPAEASFTKK